MTTSQRKAAARFLIQGKGYPERRVCRLVGLARSSARYQAKTQTTEEAGLVKWLHEFARHPRKRRRGYRLAHRELKKKWAVEGKRINAKPVHRLWRREGLSVPPRRRNRRIRGVAPDRKVVADRPNSVWCFDFVEEKTIHGQKLRTFCVSDEFTRESLAIEVGTRFVSERVCQTLE